MKDTMTETNSVLVVDDDEAVGRVLAALLTQDGLEATLVGTAEAALVALEAGAFDLVLSDVRMPGLDGLGLLKVLRSRMPDVPVVLLTAHGTVSMAVEAMREGAADFLLKPFSRDEVLYVVRKALGANRASREAPPARAAVTEEAGSDGMIGSSPALEEARGLIRLAAKSAATVLIRGETGTGKELAARAIHSLSARAAKPFVRLNCGSLPEALFESELFGYEKGAFTGAIARKPGRVELAEGGTLFLDEVGELGPTVQVKLLRLLQEKEYERLGGTETLKANVRVVAATHRALEQMTAQGAFREDLFYRLNVVPIGLPALRAHPGDVAPLARHFASTLGRANGHPGASLSTAALALLEAQSWPGNVRQLQNFIERLLVLSPQPDDLSEADVARELARNGPPPTSTAAAESLEEHRREAERAAVKEALTKARGNRALAARLLGISRRTLYNKLDELGLR
jgi:DNA-binding NtrC family response regulator